MCICPLCYASTAYVPSQRSAKPDHIFRLLPSVHSLLARRPADLQPHYMYLPHQFRLAPRNALLANASTVPVHDALLTALAQATAGQNAAIVRNSGRLRLVFPRSLLNKCTNGAGGEGVRAQCEAAPALVAEPPTSADSSVR